jgi:hypothetical protein
VHEAIEVLGWTVLVGSGIFGLVIFSLHLYFEIWDDGLKRRFQEPRICVNCLKYHHDLVPHCQDCVDRAQRKLGEKW